MIIGSIFQHKKMQETQNPTECNIVKIIHLFSHQMSPKEIFKRFKGRADFSESVVVFASLNFEPCYISDEVSGDSCLILLLLCLVTVVISIGGTALYCTLVDTYSNICTDFTQNVNFYAVNFRAFFEGLSYWLPAHT